MDKRRIKLAALAAAIALCFVMTGCYIAPDDVNTGTTENTGALPFQTLAPVATDTVTPETVVVETQNVFGAPGDTTPEPQATATPTPGQGGWSDWGRPQGGETPTPMSGTIVLETATPNPDGTTPTPGGIAVVTENPTDTPTKAPVTPTVTPPSLQRGFQGEEVRELQRKLKKLGYYKGSVDGDYGAATEAAVRAFQKANGLSADGKAGKKTLEKLNSGSAISAKQANATATPKATGKATAKPTAKVTNTPRPTATPDLTKEYYLQKGSSGERVKTLQRRLIQLGYLASGSVTGKYDDATEAAVRAFQKRNGLWEDGVAGPDTLRKIYSDSSRNSSGTPVNEKVETLEFGSEGAEVKTLQRRLQQLGYLSGSADGKYGVETQAAVIAFQQRNGLTADGKAGSATQAKLFSDSARKSGGKAVNINTSENTAGQDTSNIASTGYITLELGSEGEQVKNLQRRLRDLGYYAGDVDGRFGDGTQAAVMAFQLHNDLTIDGKAGPATQRKLYGNASSGTVSYSALEMGNSGSAVKNLQYTLYELGYYDGSIDGEFGQTTSDAVRAFQIQNKLTVDGKAGSQTLARLYSSDAVPATAAQVSYGTYRLGSRDPVVVEIQECLVEMGYMTREQISGEYDNTTMDAVRRFQTDQGLTPDGNAGERTLQILFGY